MAVVTSKSTAITNRDATPRALSNSRITKSPLMVSVGVAAAANGDSVASKYILASIPSNARVHDLKFSCSALGGAAAGDIGLYQTTDNGGAVVDADFFKAAQTLVSALSNTSLQTVMTIDKLEQPIWQLLGLSADPKIDYDIVVTLTAASAAAGYVAATTEYVI